MSKKYGPYNIELTNEECLFLSYALGAMTYAFSSLIPYFSKTDTDVNSIDKEVTKEVLTNILAVRDKAIEDTCDGDMDRASALIDIPGK